MITKHPGTGGVVDRDTVTAQLLYEITGPRYAGPDVVARFDTIRLDDDGADRVRISGVRGEPPPPRPEGLPQRARRAPQRGHVRAHRRRIAAKEAFVRAQFEAALPVRPAELVTWSTVGVERPDADTEGRPACCCAARVDPSADVVGRPFSGAAVEIALAGYPGFHLTAPPGNGSPFGVYTAAYVPQRRRRTSSSCPTAPARTSRRRPSPASPGSGGTVAARRPTRRPGRPHPPDAAGRLVHARSGDKGGDANIGLWVARGGPTTRRRAGHLARQLITPRRVRELLPEAADLGVEVHLLPNLGAVNVIVAGCSATASPRPPASTRRPRPSASGCAPGSSRSRSRSCDQ